MGDDYNTVCGTIFVIIALGLYVYFAITHIEFITWLTPTVMLVFSFIVCPLCDTVVK